MLACAVLFTQLVTTAHACGRVGRADASPSPQAAMPCAGRMDNTATLDADQPGVCQQHCQFGTTQQPAEPMQLFAAPAAEPVLLFVLTLAPAASEPAPAWRLHERERERAPPLDSRVAHCCYRL